MSLFGGLFGGKVPVFSRDDAQVYSYVDQKIDSIKVLVDSNTRNISNTAGTLSSIKTILDSISTVVFGDTKYIQQGKPDPNSVLSRISSIRLDLNALEESVRQLDIDNIISDVHEQVNDTLTPYIGHIETAHSMAQNNSAAISALSDNISALSESLSKTNSYVSPNSYTDGVAGKLLGVGFISTNQVSRGTPYYDSVLGWFKSMSSRAGLASTEDYLNLSSRVNGIESTLSSTLEGIQNDVSTVLGQVPNQVHDLVMANIPTDDTIKNLQDLITSLNSEDEVLVATMDEISGRLNNLTVQFDSALKYTAVASALDNVGAGDNEPMSVEEFLANKPVYGDSDIEGYIKEFFKGATDFTIRDYIDAKMNASASIAVNQVAEAFDITSDFSLTGLRRSVADVSFLDYLFIPEINKTAHDAITSAYEASTKIGPKLLGVTVARGGVSLGEYINSVHNRLKFNTTYGTRGVVEGSMFQFVSSLAALDEGHVWNFATYKGKPFVNYLHEMSDIETTIQNKIDAFKSSTDSSGLLSIVSQKINESITTMSITPISEGTHTTQFGNFILGQVYDVVDEAGNVISVPMYDIVKTSNYVKNIKTKIESIISTESLVGKTIDVDDYIYLESAIAGMKHTFRSYDDYDHFIENVYRIPFVDDNYNRFAIPVFEVTDRTDYSCVYKSYNDFTESYCCVEYRDGNWYVVPPELFTPVNGTDYCQTSVPVGKVMRQYNRPDSSCRDYSYWTIAVSDVVFFSSRKDADAWIDAHPEYDRNLLNLYRYRRVSDVTDVLSYVGFSYHIDTDKNLIFDNIHLSGDPPGYSDTYNAYLPTPYILFAPSISFKKGESFDYVRAVVTDNLDKLVDLPDTKYEMISWFTDFDNFARITSVPKRVQAVEDNVTFLRRYIAHVESEVEEDIRDAISNAIKTLTDSFSNMIHDVNVRLGNVNIKVGTLYSAMFDDGGLVQTIHHDLYALLDGTSELSSTFYDKIKDHVSVSVFSKKCTVGRIMTFVGNLHANMYSNISSGNSYTPGSLTAYDVAKDGVSNLNLSGTFGVLKDMIEALVSKMSGISSTLSAKLSDFQDWAETKIDDIKQKIPSLSGFEESIVEKASDAYETISTWLSGLSSKVTNIWNTALVTMAGYSYWLDFTAGGKKTYYPITVDCSSGTCWITGTTITKRAFTAKPKFALQNIMKAIGGGLSYMYKQFAAEIHAGFIKIKDFIINSVNKAISFVGGKLGDVVSGIKEAFKMIVNMLAGLVPDGTSFDPTSLSVSSITSLDWTTELSALKNVVNSIGSRITGFLPDSVYAPCTAT